MSAGSGRTARLREIARGEAMKEIYELARELQAAGKTAAGICACGCCGSEYRQGRLAVDALDRIAGYAFAAWSLSVRPAPTIDHWSFGHAFDATEAAMRHEAAGGAPS